MLCAAWEVYIEDLLIDSVEFLANSCEEAAKLPLAVKKHISRNVKAAKNELKPLGLAGHGWRLIYKEFAATAANNLNTPKSHNVDRLFQENVGIKNLSANWTYGAAEIDAFVAERGEIAHRGRSAQYIKAQKLQRYLDEIKRTATETDNFICQNLKELSPQGKQPWNRTSLD